MIFVGPAPFPHGARAREMVPAADGASLSPLAFSLFKLNLLQGQCAPLRSNPFTIHLKNKQENIKNKNSITHGCWGYTQGIDYHPRI